MTYALKFREKVLEVRAREGLTIAQVAARFDVGVASVVRWLKSPVPKARRNKKATRIDMAALERDVREHPDAFQYERAARFDVSRRGIGQALRRLGVTYKKKRSHIPKRTKTNGAASRPASRPMKRRAAPSFTSMKAALPQTCRAPMAMRQRASDALAVITGARQAAPMSSERFWRVCY